MVDASAPLNNWLSTVPDGSTVIFKLGGIYRMDKGFTFESRHDLTFEGNGATLTSNGDATCARDCSLFYLRSGNTGITIRNFNFVGNSPTPGTFDSNWEHASAITIVAGGDIEIANVTVRGVGGDGLTLSGVAPDWPYGVWIHDSHIISSGRMGVAVVAGRNVIAERLVIDTVGYGAFDIEPNDATQGAENVSFLKSTVGSWTHQLGFFFAANGAPSATVEDVTVDGNLVTQGTLRADVTVGRRRDIEFTNNVSSIAVAGPVISMAHVDGLTVTGNIQPVTTGALTSITDCTAVTTD
jgi:Right handed beta helix region